MSLLCRAKLNSNLVTLEALTLGYVLALADELVHALLYVKQAVVLLHVLLVALREALVQQLLQEVGFDRRDDLHGFI